MKKKTNQQKSLTHRSKNNILFCSPFLYKHIFLYKKDPIFKYAITKIFNRSSIIPKMLINLDIQIYSGKSWFGRFINKWMVGFKFGEFTWNRKMALYKAKQIKKKSKNKK